MSVLDSRPPAFQPSLPGFRGDLADLERLVASRKLSAADLPLGDLTAQFAGLLAGHPEADLEDVGAFLVSAARLVVIKSSLLLARPVDEEEEAGGQRAPALPEDILASGVKGLRRREGLESFAPPAPPALISPRTAPRDPAVLARAWESLRRRAEPAARRVVIPPFARIEAAVSSLIRRLQREPVVSLRGVLRGATREEAVLQFVATLELIRRRRVRASQPELFGDITLEEHERESGAAARAV